MVGALGLMQYQHGIQCLLTPTERFAARKRWSMVLTTTVGKVPHGTRGCKCVSCDALSRNSSSCRGQREHSDDQAYTVDVFCPSCSSVARSIQSKTGLMISLQSQIVDPDEIQNCDASQKPRHC